MRRRGARCSRKVSSGRPCRVIVAQSASGQPSRAAARLKALGCGRIVISSRGKWRDRVTPTPYHIGSPLANTVTRRAPTGFDRVDRRRREGVPRRTRSAPPVRHHRQMARAADQHLGGLDQRARRRREAGDAVLADADDRRARASSEVLASALTAAAASALPPRRPVSVMKSSLRPKSASAALASAAPTKPTGKPRTSAGFGRAAREHLEQAEQRGRRVADRDDRARQMRPPQLDRGGRARGLPCAQPAAASRDRAACR